MTDIDLWTHEQICVQPQDVATENEFENWILDDVISPGDIGVTFDDIGALENVKDTIKELVMLPLQRPELFCKSQLTKVYIYILSIFCLSNCISLLNVYCWFSEVPKRRCIKTLSLDVKISF